MSTQIEPTNQQILELSDTVQVRTAWRIFARNYARALLDLVRETECLPPSKSDESLPTPECLAALIRESLRRAINAAAFRPRGLWAQLRDWYSGASIETAWTELHRAYERLLLIQGEQAVRNRIGSIDAALRNNLKADDPRLTPAISRLQAIAKESKLCSNIRQELRDYERLANEASDEAYENVRSLRNLLIAISGFTIVLLVAFAVVHAFAPAFLDLSGPATKPPSDAVEVWEVELAGMLGGAIAAVFTIAKLGGFSGTYRLPVYQALIRVPAGAAVALAAVLLIQSKQIDALSAQSGLSVLAVALVFGYAPDVFLRFMDQKATSLLGETQSKNDPSRPPLTQPVVAPPTQPGVPPPTEPIATAQTEPGAPPTTPPVGPPPDKPA